MRFEFSASCNGGRSRAAIRSERGVALVITLILLSVITFMAVTFLVVSRSEQSSVSTVVDQTTARLAADTAIEEVKMALLAPMMAYTNEYNFDLLVSTNYVNRFGFFSKTVGNPYPWQSFTNVNYTYPNGTFLTGDDFRQNLQNLLYLPRVPVFVRTNRSQTNVADFRFYLDLNRNGKYDTNGLQPVINSLGTFYNLNGQIIANMIPGNTLSNTFTGDPEWIGVLEKPGFPHSPTNRFLARYAFVVVPTGKALDVNYIHNYAKLIAPVSMANGNDAFRRNQGVGSWEINLAALLADVNTNIWNTNAAFYNYNPDMGSASRGIAFNDAMGIIRYRYNYNWKNLQPFRDYVNASGPAMAAFNNDGIDGYTRGTLMVGNWMPNQPDPDRASTDNYAWSGSDNPLYFFTPQDLFDRVKITNSPANNPPTTFVDRLEMASTNVSSYDRYTYYRLLSVLGTDSAPEPASKMNLNYDNLARPNNIGVVSATNFFNWDPQTFFTNAAIRLLTGAGYGTNILKNGKIDIKIYPTNFYTPSVHRQFQLAANIFDATTNITARTNALNPGLMGLPSVFRPIFERRNDEIFIVGFREVTDDSMAYTNTAPIFRDLSLKDDRDALQPLDMIYGVPIVVGARKGVPNFNEFAMQTLVYVTRKLEFRRPSLDAKVNETNQMYIVGVSNIFALEAWNSYTNTLRYNLDMICATDVTMVFSNEVGIIRSNRFSRSAVVSTNFWNGFKANGAFQVPISNLVTFLPTSTYRHSDRQFIPLTKDFERRVGFPVPQWTVNMSMRTRFVLVEKRTHRIVDYVNLQLNEQRINLTEKLAEDGDCQTMNGAPGSQWCTNRLQNSSSVGMPTYGIINQIHAGQATPMPVDWNSFNLDPSVGADREKAADGFRVNMGGTPRFYIGATYHKSNVFYAPFLPYRTVYQHTTLQANDPIVHYTVGDLQDLERTNNVEFNPKNPPLENIGRINGRYEPWTPSLDVGSTRPTRYDLSLKDPLVGRTDDFQFPTNKLPTLGWLGRVHRGTPWQTVYMKAPGVALDQWQKWTGNGLIVTNWDGRNSTNYDAELSLPYRDRYIFDLFTVALNDNASRGQMSVNQTSLAGWSAILSGVVAITNDIPDTDLANNPFLKSSNTYQIIQPAGTYDVFDKTNYPPLARIVDSINRTRANTNLFPKQVFTHMGDILAVPELTIGAAFTRSTNYLGTYPNGHWTETSPFLNLGNPGTLKAKASNPQDMVTQQQLRAISDSDYERIPQQILSLLRLDQAPRFVVYAYGQALKPAEKSIITSGPYFGLCTNYQVTAEVATRAVVKIEGAPENPRVVVESFNTLPPD